MKKRWPLAKVCVLACTVVLLSWGQTPRKALGQPSRSVTTQDEFVGYEMRCENGLTVIIDKSPSLRVLVYGNNGALMRSHDLAVPDSVKVNATDASVSRQGLVAVAAHAVRSDGTAASLILIFEKAGAPSRMIRTDPIVVWRVALAPGGYVWALGVNKDIWDRGGDWPVFYKFALDGRLLGQFVMRSTFPRREDPVFHANDGGSCTLRATSNGVGAYIASEREWVELDNSGNVLGRWKPPSPFGGPQGGVETVAFTDSGSVYAQWSLDSRRVLCKLNRSAGKWEPIDGTSYQPGDPLPAPVRLHGSDGNQLVFLAYRGRAQEILWFDEPR